MKKNKIAILTQPLENNYGGIIQNYALQKVLKNLGHQPLTINRVGKIPISPIRLMLSICKQYVYKYLLNKNILTHRERIEISKNNIKFLEKYVDRSVLIDRNERLLTYFKKHTFDTVIVGSDQTWRPKYSPNIYSYYLDFLKDNPQIKKIAYASSFGTSEWEYSEEETQICAALIQQFNAVSVREDSGVFLSAKHLNRNDAVHLLDPTLLLNAEDYSKLINRSKENKGLFTYVLDDSKEKLAFMQEAALNLGLEIHKNQAIKFDPVHKRKFEDYIIPPLEGWLQGFRDAEFVITDSFHGTVFSIINRKPFISLVNEKRGASRFYSLLGQLGLTNRLVDNIREFNTELLFTPINYDEVEVELNFLKDKSFHFLINNFSN